MRYLLDTHTWIWANSKPGDLSEKVRNLIEDTRQYDELILSAISPWEFCKLLQKGRVTVHQPPEEWLDTALSMKKLRLVPLTPRIAYQSTVLPQPFHNDPADQIIVATAREENATIITKDSQILAYKHVKSLW